MPKILRHTPKVPAELAIAAGKALKIARKERGWRQQDLAERLNTTRQTVARLEQGDPTIAVGIFLSALWLLDTPLPEGRGGLLTFLLSLVEEHSSSRVRKRKERSIDDKF